MLSLASSLPQSHRPHRSSVSFRMSRNQSQGQPVRRPTIRENSGHRSAFLPPLPILVADPDNSAIMEKIAARYPHGLRSGMVKIVQLRFAGWPGTWLLKSSWATSTTALPER